MPEIKINIDNEEYTLQCEPGEEDELNKAIDVVNEKMVIFKDEMYIKKTTKLVMVALLLASESNEKIQEYNNQKNKIIKIENLLEKLEKILNAI
mgnify:CR=1 FL=1|jgi:cell division protein ZapA (FtsZ GTPase activity inhibitor)